MSKVMSYIDILEFYGEKKQIDKLAEEQAELQHAIMSGTKEDILEEIADNLVLMRQFHALHEWQEDMVDAMGEEFKIIAEIRGDMDELIEELILDQAKLQHALRGKDRFRVFMRSGQVKNLMQIIAKRNDLLPYEVEAKVEEKRKRTSDEIQSFREKFPEPAPVSLVHCHGPFPPAKPIGNVRRVARESAAACEIDMDSKPDSKPRVPWESIGTVAVNISINPSADLSDIVNELEKTLAEEMEEVAEGVHDR